MKRKFAILGLTAAACLGLALGLAACTDNNADNTGGGENGGGTTDDPVPVHVHRVSADSDGVCDDCHETLYEGSMGFTLSDNLKYYKASASGCKGDVTVPSYYKGRGETEYLPVLELTLGGNNVESLHIPAGIEAIGRDSLNVVCMNALTEVTIESGNTHYYVEDDALYKVDDDNLIMAWNIGETYTIPDKVDTIRTSMFYYCGDLVNLVIPASVKEIQRNAFANCKNLKSVIFEEGSQLDSIGENAFLRCASIKEIQIPASVSSLGTSLFKDCENLQSVIFEDGSIVDALPYYIFDGCAALETVKIPAPVSSLDVSLFRNCNNLKHVLFEDGSRLKEIQDKMFFEKPLESIILPKSVENIGRNAFSRSSLKSIKFEEGSRLKRIGEYAFEECTLLTEVLLPQGLETIADFAFLGCSSLKEVVLPDTLKTLGDRAFSDNALEELILPASVQTVGWAIIYNSQDQEPVTTLYVYAPMEAVQTWSEEWSLGAKEVIFRNE